MIDEIGNKYGNLTVIARGPVDRRGEILWVCECGCGNKVNVLGSNLRNGRQKSCGCKRRLPKGEAALNFLFRALKKSARERGLEWSISREQVRELTKKPCYYCGIEPRQEIKNGYNGYNGGIKYNGLDRVDNSRGYVIDNVVPCCRVCNFAKSNKSIDEFREWVARVYHHWIET